MARPYKARRSFSVPAIDTFGPLNQEMDSAVELTLEDNCIGIPAHELPRIFDRGFTGSNGRSRGGSTGMGLYLARRLATALEIELRAASEEGKGTRMTLLFPARENLSKW